MNCQKTYFTQKDLTEVKILLKVLRRVLFLKHPACVCVWLTGTPLYPFWVSTRLWQAGRRGTFCSQVNAWASGTRNGVSVRSTCLPYLSAFQLAFLSTNSSAVAERPRDALCPSVDSFNSVIPRAQSFIKPPLATARAASCIDAVHLFVCLSVAKLQKRDFLKKLSNLELWSLLTTYRKSYTGFSKNPLLNP